MAETVLPPPPGGPGLSRAEEEAAFYHESALNAAWTGSRLACGVLSMGFGAFVFAFFYLRSLNSHHLWYPPGFSGPKVWQGTVIMALIVASALIQTLVLQRIKAGHKGVWLAGAAVALILGLAAVAFQVWQLLNLSFQPGANAFASVFTGATPVFLVTVFAVMVWLEILIMRARPLPEIHFVELPPTFAEAFALQRFQASLSAFTVVWNYTAILAIIMWVLFYLVH